jgi:hypothetical protein
MEAKLRLGAKEMLQAVHDAKVRRKLKIEN